MSALFSKKLAFFVQKIPLLKAIVWELWDLLVLISAFVRWKVTVTQNIIFADSVFRIRPPDCSKLTKNPKNENNVTIFRHDVNVKFSMSCFVSLIKFSYWSRFHVNIITGSGIMTILFYKGLTRNPEFWNTPVWVLPNIWRLGQVMDTKFGRNTSNRMLLNATECYSFYFCWVIKGESTGEGAGAKLPPPPPRLGLPLISLGFFGVTFSDWFNLTYLHNSRKTNLIAT